MTDYLVESFRTPYPDSDVCLRTHRGRGVGDVAEQLSPGLVSLWAVRGARNRNQAIALVVEKAAGCRVTVEQLIPRPQPKSAQMSEAQCRDMHEPGLRLQRGH